MSVMSRTVKGHVRTALSLAPQSRGASGGQHSPPPLSIQCKVSIVRARTNAPPPPTCIMGFTALKAGDRCSPFAMRMDTTSNGMLFRRQNSTSARLGWLIMST